eukprot:15210348-Alexandrium_andersonii.AAC.1
MAGRAHTIVRASTSAGVRAAQWGTLIVACVPYPAQFCLPGAPEEHALLAAFRVVCRGRGWAP